MSAAVKHYVEVVVSPSGSTYHAHCYSCPWVGPDRLPEGGRHSPASHDAQDHRKHAHG